MMAYCQDTNVVFHASQGEVYIVVYRPGQEVDAMMAVKRWASHDGLGFNWQDAAEMVPQIKALAEARA